jgi:hypothetical protein
MPDPTPHEPSAETRRQVSTMVAFGIPQEKIAAILAISPPTLRKYYREEIDFADAKAQSMVAKFLFSAATGEALKTGATHADCLRSAMFWMKTWAGWKETAVQEITGKDGEPLPEGLSLPEAARHLAFILASGHQALGTGETIEGSAIWPQGEDRAPAAIGPVMTSLTTRRP